MREVGKSLDIDLYVFGPETHMTAIVAMALGEPFTIRKMAGCWCQRGRTGNDFDADLDPVKQWRLLPYRPPPLRRTPPTLLKFVFVTCQSCLTIRFIKGFKSQNY